MAGAPDVSGDRAGRGGSQEDRVVVLNHVTARMRQFTLNTVVIDRHHRREAPQASIQLLRSRSEWSNIFPQHQSDFRTLIDEVYEQRSRLDHATFESFREITAADTRQTRVEHDRDPLLIFRRELTHRQPS